MTKKNSGLFFAVDTLEFLHRGGRIGGAQRFIGSALNLKPILALKEGKVEGVEKATAQNQKRTTAYWNWLPNR